VRFESKKNAAAPANSLIKKSTLPGKGRVVAVPVSGLCMKVSVVVGNGLSMFGIS
jgi:hypothetical protein